MYVSNVQIFVHWQNHWLPVRQTVDFSDPTTKRMQVGAHKAGFFTYLCTLFRGYGMGLGTDYTSLTFPPKHSILPFYFKRERPVGLSICFSKRSRFLKT